MKEKFKGFKTGNLAITFLFILFFAFLQIGYAKVDSVNLNVEGTTEAIVPDSVFISDIVPSDNSFAIIENYDKTVFSGSVILSDSDLNSSQSFDITITNNSISSQFFKEIKYQSGADTYSNEDIVFSLDSRMYDGYELASGSSVTFNLSFNYSDSFKSEHQINPITESDIRLKFVLNFYFSRIISFNLNNGEGTAPASYEISCDADLNEITGTAPTRTGYTFQGFYDSSDYTSGQKFYDSQLNASDISNLTINQHETVLYAGWKPIEYTITYHSGILPEGYTQVTYISSGSSQYIDTGIKGNNSNLSFEIEYEWNSFPNGYSTVFGAYQSENHVCTRFCQYQNSITYFNINSMAGGSTPLNKTRAINTRYTETLKPKGTNQFTMTSGGQSSTGTRTTATDINNNIFLFSCSSSGTFSNIKVYYFVIYDNGTPVRNFIPCKNASGVPGMYDTVEGKFYASGNGTFNAGADVSDTSIQTLIYDVKDEVYENSFTLTGFSFVDWTYDNGISVTDYDEKEEVINLSSVSDSNLDFYAKWNRQVRIYFSDLKRTVDTTEADISEITDIIPSNDYLTFGGWYDSKSVKYFDENGVYTNESIKTHYLNLVGKFYFNDDAFENDYYSLAYIQTNGSQYVNTGVPGNNNNLGFEIEYEWVSFPSAYGALFGSYVDENTVSTRIIMYRNERTFFNINSKAGGSSKYEAATRQLNTVYVDTLLPSGNDFAYTTNSVTTNGTRTTANNSSVPIYIFANGNGTGATVSIKLYYLRIYDGDNLIRFYIPCKRKSDNKIGLFDAVNGTFNVSVTNSNFTAGPQTN